MRALTTCSAGCGAIVQSGRCDNCRHEADRKRGTFAQRGYRKGHKRFRKAVLQRDVICQRCRNALATVADHYPLSRRELVDAGLNPDDPQHGRGLCERCHNSETARNQPGGFNQPR